MVMVKTSQFQQLYRVGTFTVNWLNFSDFRCCFSTTKIVHYDTWFVPKKLFHFYPITFPSYPISILFHFHHIPFLFQYSLRPVPFPSRPILIPSHSHPCPFASRPISAPFPISILSHFHPISLPSRPILIPSRSHPVPFSSYPSATPGLFPLLPGGFGDLPLC